VGCVYVCVCVCDVNIYILAGAHLRSVADANLARHPDEEDEFTDGGSIY
jgi:hypothetical protein